ncbi:tetratricopeptide repeat protein [Ktedonosporobacter rubrisoli]|uniref:Tetratricopeptide repeat protein n=1 Tax=Ktedonosporobacter rubrisoli TaxID=2509675 RepID=A0A4P6JUC6_KTERU|nr:tetratricopeptide repeat protein [Ktedonosporobacter rubrisoli]QBD79227.1 tetratricopeptide repeat protein [Ktedonosporobacter rubrisoli]
MAHTTDIQMMLYRARLLLEEGQNEAALASLEQIHTQDEKQQRYVAYLLGWGYTQLKRWDDAIRVLSPLLEHVHDMDQQETLIERERVALYLLRLGIAAVNLSHYEDASQHFSMCLKFLHDRRVHLPVVRIQARYSLAMTCIMRGLYTAAIRNYEDALRLCRHYEEKEEVPHIYYGLCDAYRHTGDFISACTAGQEALRLYQERSNRAMEARMHHMLGQIRFQIGDFRDAADHYTESLAIATSHNSPTMIMLNCASLADLRLAESRLDEAKRYCQLALENMERVDNAHMKGSAYCIVGKVVHEDARQARDTQKRLLLEEAVSWFEKAKEQLASTQAYADMAEVYEYWASALEELGRVEEAIECWRFGYEVLSHAHQEAK